MKLIFSLFISPAVGLLAAKITLRAAGSSETAPLLGLALLFAGLTYGFRYLKYLDRRSLGRASIDEDFASREESRP